MKHEVLSRYISMSPIGQVIGRNLENLTPPGSPLYSLPNPEELGYPERNDTDLSLTPSEINEAIFKEGMQLAGAEVIEIDNDRELLVFNTTAASTHTVLTATYQEFEEIFRKHCERLGFPVNQSILINGKESTSDSPKPPRLVPLDILTWVMIRTKSEGVYMPCDINDLTSCSTGNELVDKHRLRLNNDQLNVLFEAVARRNSLATETLLNLHNNVLRNKMKFLRHKTSEDMLQGCLSGYYRGDEAKQLGQFTYDHRGKGPMSNPTLHFRVTDHFTMEDANILDQQTPSLSFEEMIVTLKTRYPDYFSGNIEFMPIKPDGLLEEDSGEILRRFLLDTRFSEYDLLKSVDPLASLAHKFLSQWLQEQMGHIFSDSHPIVQLFAHHTNDYERELRVSEGATVIFEPTKENYDKNQIVANAFAKFSEWIGGTLYPMWDRINELVRTRMILTQQEYVERVWELMDDYQLPADFINALLYIIPTEKQLKNLRNELDQLPESHEKEEKKRKVDKKIVAYQQKKRRSLMIIASLETKLREGKGELEDLVGLLTAIQSSQIFDNEGLPEESRVLNQGYNVPGTPGTAITYHFDEQDQLHLNIGWLLSTKGLAELWLGNILKRKERRDR